MTISVIRLTRRSVLLLACAAVATGDPPASAVGILVHQGG